VDGGQDQRELEGDVSDLYLPDPVYQLDGSPGATSNCWASVAVWQLDGQSGGEIEMRPQTFRKPAGKPPTGGGNLADIQRGFAKLGRAYRLTTLLLTDVRAMLVADGSRRLIAIPTDYSIWPQKCDAPGFDGFHMVGIRPGLLPEKRVLVMNPVCSVPGASREARYQRVPLADVLDAAKACAKAVGTPSGYLQVGIVQVPRPADAPSDASTSERLERQLAEAVAALHDIRDQADQTLTSIAAAE
jgi:hypothetical protein